MGETGETPGEIAYKAYHNFAGGRSLATDAPLPGWWDLPENIRQAWHVAAEAVLESRQPC